MEADDWASLSDQELLERRISKLGLRLEGTTARTAHPATLRRALRSRAGVASALSHRRRMVRAGRHPGDFHSVLSRPRPAARAGADDDARGRGRNARVVHETDATRGGACLQLCLPTAAEKKVAADFRADVARRDAGFLSAAPVQPQLCRESRRLVCAEPSGRRFRRDFRRLAHAGARLAPTLRGLEGAAKTRIRR